MDKRISTNLVVGTFVTLGIIVFVYLIFSVGDGGALFGRHFTLYGKYSEVKGLHAGSEVSLAGLRVGVIENIKISKTEPRELIVEMSIARSVKEHIRHDSTARIRTQGVLGDKYVEISLGSSAQPEIEDGAFIEAVEDKDIFAKGGDLLEKLRSEFKEGGKVQSLIVHLDEVAENLSVLLKDVRTEKGLMHELIYGKGGSKLTRTVEHLESIFAKVDKGEGTLGALVNDPTIFEDLKYLFGGAKRSTILQYFLRKTIESEEVHAPKK